jgi:hypothetical protein
MKKTCLVLGTLLLGSAMFQAKASIITESFQLQIIQVDNLGWSSLDVGQTFGMTIEYNDPVNKELAFTNQFFPNGDVRFGTNICAVDYSGTDRCDNPSTVSSFTFRDTLVEASNLINLNGLDLSLLFNIPADASLIAPTGIFSYGAGRLTHATRGTEIGYRSSNLSYDMGFNTIISSNLPQRNGQARVFTDQGVATILYVIVDGQTPEFSLNIQPPNNPPNPPVNVSAPQTLSVMLLSLFGLFAVRKIKAKK